jgi:hypothetical protein
MDRSTRRQVVERAREAIADGDPEKACRLLERERARQPDDHVLGAWLGVAFVESREFERAVPLLEVALARRPGFLPAAHALLKVPLRQGDVDGAIRAYRRLAPAVPRLAAAVRATVEPDPVGAAFAAATADSATPDHDCTVFYHLPFTGGTSWQRALTYLYDHTQRFDIRRRKGLRQLARYDRLSTAELDRVRCIHLHHPYPIDPRGRRLRYFTVLRRPVDRYLSGYYKHLADPRILAIDDTPRSTSGLAASVEHFAAAGLGDGQARQLAALHPDLRQLFTRHCRPGRLRRRLRAEKDLFYVTATEGLGGDELLEMATDVLTTAFLPPVVLEHMEAGYLAVFAQLGIPVVPRLQHIATSGRPRSEVDDAVRERIAELHPVDTVLHARARADFEQRFGELIAAVDADRRDPPPAATPH